MVASVGIGILIALLFLFKTVLMVALMVLVNQHHHHHLHPVVIMVPLVIIQILALLQEQIIAVIQFLGVIDQQQLTATGAVGQILVVVQNLVVVEQKHNQGLAKAQFLAGEQIFVLVHLLKRFLVIHKLAQSHQQFLFLLAQPQ